MLKFHQFDLHRPDKLAVYQVYYSHLYESDVKQ